MIYPHFSLPPQLSPSHQRYQHQHHQHLPSMSIIHQQPQLPVTPLPTLPTSFKENPKLWMSMTKAQRRAAKEVRWAQQPHLKGNQHPNLFFSSWTPGPCSDPLCCMPHQQPCPSQTTSPSPCSPMTSRPPSTPSTGLPGIWVTLCKEKDVRPFKSPVSAHFP